MGIYPAIDPLDSTSRQLDPLVVGQEHYEVARGVQNLLQRYKELKDIITNTTYATSKDDLKPVLQGVLFQIEKDGIVFDNNCSFVNKIFLSMEN